MSAGWHQSALGASPVHKEFSLQVDRSFLELLEAFAFEQLPDLLLGQVHTSGDKLPLLGVQAVIEAGNGCSVLVPQRAQVGYSLSPKHRIGRSFVRPICLQLLFLLRNLRAPKVTGPSLQSLALRALHIARLHHQYRFLVDYANVDSSYRDPFLGFGIVCNDYVLSFVALRATALVTAF